jgi:alpha-1,3-rhamnosyl/mannosyltransferase
MRSIQAASPSDLRVQPIDVSNSSLWPGAVTVGRGTPAPRPVRPLCPFVLTLFDLATIDAASSYELGFRVYYNTLLRAHMRAAAIVIVTSQATLDAASERWPRQRYRLIPLAVDPWFQANEGQPRTSEPTVLYTGGFDPRKRVSDLIEAVVRVRARIPAARLVLSGEAPTALVDLARATLGEQVTFTGYLGDEELADWYRRAWVLAYPTDMEGFGFPIVEAFASGTPVVATRAGSVEEVAGDCALLVSGADVTQLADALERLLSDGQLRDSLRAAGLRRASMFGWDVVAQSTLDVYREALAIS